MQRLSSAQARQSSLLMTAVPTLAQTFSCCVRGWMAVVGHTVPQARHSGAQAPLRGTSTGEKSPAGPAPSQTGCRACVGQARTQAPQRRHRARKSPSGREPGARTGSGPAAPARGASPATTLPRARDPQKALREGSAESAQPSLATPALPVLPAEASCRSVSPDTGRARPKRSAPCLQTAVQA